MQRISGARLIAVRLWRSRPAIVCDIIYIAAPALIAKFHTRRRVSKV
jgi:hypothetical protein